ncbi:hypothetical protein FS749_009133 [Ceratobasidium sp. UAMH 11750]|nr:hypothetical protein FS749_009133 [Ceratobasidium sp. UAMH 11750]
MLDTDQEDGGRKRARADASLGRHTSELQFQELAPSSCVVTVPTDSASQQVLYSVALFFYYVLADCPMKLGFPIDPILLSPWALALIEKHELMTENFDNGDVI